MHLSAAIPGGWGVNPVDIRGNSAGLCRQCLARDGGIGPLLQDTRGKTLGICNIAAILKMKDPDRGNGFQNGDGENKKL